MRFRSSVFLRFPCSFGIELSFFSYVDVNVFALGAHLKREVIRCLEWAIKLVGYYGLALGAHGIPPFVRACDRTAALPGLMPRHSAIVIQNILLICNH